MEGQKKCETMEIISYDGKVVRLPETFNAPEGSVGRWFATEFLPRYCAADIPKFFGGVRIEFGKDENGNRINWGAKVFEIYPGDNTQKDFTIFGRSDKICTSIRPL